jgi:Leucine-rich repeat (LRR) protein
MKKLYPLLSVLFLIYWGCLDPLNIFDFNDEETINLWGVDYSIENTTELDLGNSGLTGEIPPEIGNLTNLEVLSLWSNQLTGSIPPEIGNLTNLNELNLSGNQLTGSIPSEIGNLSNLYLLYLYDNQLTGEIPESICDLNINWSNLNFRIHNNQLCPPYPSCVEDYVGLQDVCSCGLDDDEVVYLWGNCYSIEYTTELDLSNSGLTGEIPSEIGNLTNLTELDLSENQLTGSIPPEIGNLINLSGRITTSSWGFTTYHPGLNLSDNLLTGSIPPEIGNLTNLIGLYLYNNQLTGEIPESICDLNLNWYYYFSISNNQLCPPYPSCVEDNVGTQDTSDCP